MGYFYYSQIKKTDVLDIDFLIKKISKNLFKEKYQIKRRDFIENDSTDRLARWEFWISDENYDCAFTMTLLINGQMEFKVPRSQWDENWEDQQKIRRRLVRCK